MIMVAGCCAMAGATASCGVASAATHKLVLYCRYVSCRGQKKEDAFTHLLLSASFWKIVCYAQSNLTSCRSYLSITACSRGA